MLALVKKPHIELSIHGEQTDELIAWIKKKYDIVVLADKPEDELVSIESTGFWQEMGAHHQPVSFPNLPALCARMWNSHVTTEPSEISPTVFQCRILSI